MDDETDTQRVWLYCLQMVSLLLALGALFAKYQLDLLEAGRDDAFKFAGTRSQ